MNVSIIESYKEFAWKFVKAQLNRQTNDCTSPIGLYTLLSVVYYGARGQTQQELAKLLFPASEPSVEDPLRNVGEWNRSLQSQKAISCNETMIQTANELLPEFHTILHQAFGDALQLGRSNAALEMINEIYFLDEWKKRFTETKFRFSPAPCPRYLLYSGLFSFTSRYTPDATLIPFLKQENTVGCLHTEEAISVTLPFRSQLGGCPVFHMVLAMPYKKTLEQYLEGQIGLPKAMHPVHRSLLACQLYLPKFEVHGKNKDLSPALRSLGAKKTFDEYHAEICDLTSDSLYIKIISQDTLLKVTETGAEAHAVTWILLNPTVGIPPAPPIPQFFFDHPFVFSLWLSSPIEIPLFFGAFQGTD